MLLPLLASLPTVSGTFEIFRALNRRSNTKKEMGFEAFSLKLHESWSLFYSTKPFYINSINV